MSEDKKEQVVIIKNKDGSFNGYQIIKNKSLEELKALIEEYNENPKNINKGFIVTDKLMIDVILKKESSETVKSYVNDIVDQVESIENSFQSEMGCITSSLDALKRFILTT